ncbi:hypothetical protein KRX57_01295 [Weeksellaceae bacterium TAE3-ERU29]|nr:hypothetical protein [Weeksellaceae bacterium TAE3-ERU29]
MRKNIVLLFLFFSHIIFAQEVISLKDKYLLNLIDVLKCKTDILKMEEYVDYDLYLRTMNILNTGSKSIDFEQFKKAEEKRITLLEKGNYILTNDNNERENFYVEKFQFEIGTNHNFVGKALVEWTQYGRKVTSIIYFKNGKVSKIEHKSPYENFAVFQIQDSVCTTTFFKNNILEAKQISKIGKGKLERLGFYENGNVYKKHDYINRIEQFFREDGIIAESINVDTKETINYDSEGKKTSHVYFQGSQEVSEYFDDNEEIERKVIVDSDKNIRTHYYYKKGEIDTYEIEDKWGNIKVYDRNNKFIEDKQIPRVYAPGP